MGQESRPPRAGFIVMLVLLAGSIAGTAWWLNRPDRRPAPRSAAGRDRRLLHRPGGRRRAGDRPRPRAARPGRGSPRRRGREPSPPGRPLVRLDDSAARARLIQAQATLDAAQVELDVTLRDKERVPNQIAAREAILKAAAARVEAARKLIQQRQGPAASHPAGQARAGGDGSAGPRTGADGSLAAAGAGRLEEDRPRVANPGRAGQAQGRRGRPRPGRKGGRGLRPHRPGAGDDPAAPGGQAG